MSTRAIALPTRSTSGVSDDLDHIVCTCCNPDLALCGKDMTGTDWVDDDKVLWCAVCDDLNDVPCRSECDCEQCS